MLANAIRFLALALPFAALSDTVLGATRGYRDMRPTVVLDKIGRSTGQLIGVAAAVAAGSVALLAPLWAVAYLPAAAVGWIWLRRVRRRPRSAAGRRPAGQPGGAQRGHRAVEPPADGTGSPPPAGPPGAVGSSAGMGVAAATMGGFWRFTAPRAAGHLAQIIIQRLDIVLVAIMLGPAEAAIYTAATRFLIVGQFGNSAISMAAQPRFTELFAVGASREANRIYPGDDRLADHGHLADLPAGHRLRVGRYSRCSGTRTAPVPR